MADRVNLVEMGYGHDWREFFDGDPENLPALRANFETLILPLADAGCLLVGPYGTGLPETTDDYIAFNGLRYCGSEPAVSALGQGLHGACPLWCNKP